ncbi:MAG: YceI family protein [bacterium]
MNDLSDCNYRITLAVCLGLLSFFVVIPQAHATSDTYSILSNVWFEGTSSVRDWVCKDVPANGSLKLPRSPESTQDLYSLLQRLPDTTYRTTVKAPVNEIGCAQGERMNNHMRNALEANQYPTISFNLNAVRPNELIDTTPKKIKADLVGTLTIKKTTRKVRIPVKVHITPDGVIQVSGQIQLDMTNYKVKPPTVMWTITVYDDITVHVDSVLRP